MGRILEKDTLIKSKKRVADHGEVFTPPWLVEAMLDLTKEESERIDSRCCAMLEGGLLEEVTGGTAGFRAQTSSPTPTHPNTPPLGR